MIKNAGSAAAQQLAAIEQTRDHAKKDQQESHGEYDNRSPSGIQRDAMEQELAQAEKDGNTAEAAGLRFALNGYRR